MKPSQLLWRQANRNLVLSLLLLITIPYPVLAQTTNVETSAEQTSPAVPPTAASTTPASYILGAGDQITVTVFGYEEYTGGQTILPDGTIKLPLLGSVPAAGQTAESLTRDLTARLNTLLVDPVVTVSLNSLRPVVVNVAGEVQRPGPVQLRSISGTAPTTPAGSTTGTGTPSPSGAVPTLSAALVEAGGITRNADIRQVTVRRVLPDGNSTTLTVNLWDAIWSDAASQNIVLQADDTILVPRLSADATIDRRLISRSSFAPRTVRVRVVGQVNSPGQIEISPDSSLSSAIASAGGPTVDARLGDVGLIRMDENGSISTQEVNLRDLNDSEQVQEGDVIVVPEQGASSFLRGLGRVLSPLGSVLSIFNQFLRF